jgi:hypothetical protein
MCGMRRPTTQQPTFLDTIRRLSPKGVLNNKAEEPPEPPTVIAPEDGSSTPPTPASIEHGVQGDTLPRQA